MRVKTAKCWALALVLASMGLAGGAKGGDVIAFTGLPAGAFTGPRTEGNFIYNTLPGAALFVNTLFGNPPPEMNSGVNGGILRIVRNGGGLFTFDGADVSQSASLGATDVRFRGVLN